MAKAKKARRHTVYASLSNFQLAKAKSALNLYVYSRGEKVGELQVGRGSIYWWGKHWHKPKRLSWSRFTDEMNRIAYGHRN